MKKLRVSLLGVVLVLSLLGGCNGQQLNTPSNGIPPASPTTPGEQNNPNNTTTGSNKPDDTKNNVNIGLLIYSVISSILVGPTIIYIIVESQRKNSNSKVKNSIEKPTKIVTGQRLQEQINLLKETTQSIDESLKNLPYKADIITIFSEIKQQYQSQSTRTQDYNQIIQEFKSSVSQISSYQTLQFSLISNSINEIHKKMEDFDIWLNIPQQKNSSHQSEKNQAIDIKNNEVLDSRINNLEAQIQTLQTQLEQASSEKQELEIQLSQLQQYWEQLFNSERDKLQQSFNTEQQNLNAQLTQERTKNANINNDLSYLQAENQTLQARNQTLESQITALQPPIVNEPEALPSEIARLVDIYNQDPRLLGQYTSIIAEVIVDGQSLSNYRKDNKQPITLKIPDSGSSEYLIVSPNGGVSSVYFLFPKQNIVGRAEAGMIQALFQCHEYRKDETSKFTLKMPAKVSRSSTNEHEWRFEEQNKGILQF